MWNHSRAVRAFLGVQGIDFSLAAVVRDAESPYLFLTYV